jgi:antitoxin MazE
MDLQIAKWGNSLAVRIPAEFARQVGIVEGDAVQVSTTIDGGISILPKKWNRQAFAAELSEVRRTMPLGAHVMDELRRSGSF